MKLTVDPSKAQEHDMISIQILQLCGPSICKLFEIIFKSCLKKDSSHQTGNKQTLILFIGKNYKQSVINCHPVPLLQICGKIFELLLYNSLFGFFMKNKSPRSNLNLDQVALAKTNCCQLLKKLTNLLMWA